jgi:hypothetical protein
MISCEFYKNQENYLAEFKNESDDTLIIQFHGNDILKINGFPDSINLYAYRIKYKDIFYKDSLIKSNLPNNTKYLKYFFNNYIKDSVPMTFFISGGFECDYFDYYFIFSDKSSELISYMKYLHNKVPSEYYNNDTLMYNNLLRNILSIYILPKQTFVFNPPSNSALLLFSIYDSINVIRKKNTIICVNANNYLKYLSTFKKYNNGFRKFEFIIK